MRKIASILLIDDDDATNCINKLLINRLSITNELLVAKNGKDALKLLEDCASNKSLIPDLILLDINMPVLDGFGFLNAFQDMDCPGKEDTLIAVLSTSLNPKDLERVQKAGVQVFLNKPLTKESLIDLVTTYMG